MGEDESEDVGEKAVLYDEVDSSRTIEEVVGGFIMQKPGSLPIGQAETESDHDVHIIGACLERFTDHEFSSCTATNAWMEWDAGSSM